MIWQREIEYAGRSQRVVLKQLGENRYQVQIGDDVHELVVTRRAAGMVEFSHAGQSYVALGGMVGDKLQLRMAGETWMLGIEERQRSAGQTDDSGEVHAPMTGTILQVLVAEGDKVESGQPLVVLSAMKMEHRLEAQIAGVVSRLDAEEGANVDQGHLLVRIVTVEKSDA